MKNGITIEYSGVQTAMPLSHSLEKLELFRYEKVLATSLNMIKATLTHHSFFFSTVTQEAMKIVIPQRNPKSLVQNLMMDKANTLPDSMQT